MPFSLSSIVCTGLTGTLMCICAQTQRSMLSIISSKQPQRQKLGTLINSTSSTFRCAVISHLSAGKTETYDCDGGWMEGRFVNIIIPGSDKTLTLCEVEVYGAKDGMNGK